MFFLAFLFLSLESAAPEYLLVKVADTNTSTTTASPPKHKEKEQAREDVIKVPNLSGDDYWNGATDTRKKPGHIHAPAGNTQVAAIPVLRREFSIKFRVEFQHRWNKLLSVVYLKSDANTRLFDWKKENNWWGSQKRCYMEFDDVIHYDCKKTVKSHHLMSYEIKQSWENNKYIFRIYINREEVFSKVNYKAKIHRNVRVFWGGANGYMRDLSITSKAGHRNEIICPRLMVSKANYASCNGNYAMTNLKAGGRPVYKREGNGHPRYIDFAWNQWRISPNPRGGGYHLSGSTDIEPWTSKWKNNVVVMCAGRGD